MQKQILFASAIAGILVAAGCASGPTPSDKSGGTTSTETVKGECHGINSCKGTGDCGGPGYSCSGKNSCKGQGWLSLTQTDCLAKGGTFKAN